MLRLFKCKMASCLKFFKLLIHFGATVIKHLVNDPLFLFHRWKANLHSLEIGEPNLFPALRHHTRLLSGLLAPPGENVWNSLSIFQTAFVCVVEKCSGNVDSTWIGYFGPMRVNLAIPKFVRYTHLDAP